MIKKKNNERKMIHDLDRKKKAGKKQQKQFDYSEIYRQLRTNLEFASLDKDELQVINVTSTNPAEGKSSVSANLALIYAAKYPKTLIIDCDLRKPVIHKIFRISNKTGLSNLLKDGVDVATVDINSSPYFERFKDKEDDGKLYVLSAGSKVYNPLELLASEKFSNLIAELRKKFNMIIMDCPPISAVSDSIYVSHVSDGTVFVVSSKDTDKNQAKTAVTQLKRNGVNLLGAVLTKVEDSNTLNYYNYYSD